MKRKQEILYHKNEFVQVSLMSGKLVKVIFTFWKMNS